MPLLIELLELSTNPYRDSAAIRYAVVEPLELGEGFVELRSESVERTGVFDFGATDALLELRLLLRQCFV